jgi:hypothetical protein
MNQIVCTKISYESRSEAQSAIVRMFRAGKRKKGKVSVYQCTGCGLFHWGHESRLKRRRAATTRPLHEGRIERHHTGP